MLRYLVIMLDASAPSFCYYPDPPKGDSQKMSVDTLRQAVYFAQTHALSVNVLAGEMPGEEIRRELDKINHIFIGPDAATNDFVWDITVLGPDDDFAALRPNPDKNLILRIPLARMEEIPGIVSALSGKFLRLNIILEDSWQMTPELAPAYRKVLDSVPALPEGVQLDILTDRPALAGPRHCGAGDVHLTVAPDGKLYICPGFFFDDPSRSCGDVFFGPDIPLPELFKLEKAPICRACDAWQCKRCVWMNHRRTREVNTPSRGQCITAHVERNKALPDNPSVYLDPFEIIGR